MEIMFEGAWLEFEFGDKKIGFKVLPTDARDYEGDQSKVSIYDRVSKLIADWTFNEPCTPENKAKFLPVIVMWEVKREEDGDDPARPIRSVGTEIMSFSRAPENFLKN